MENKQYTTRELFRRFAPYFKKYRFTLCMDLFCAALTTVCELVLPLIMRYITNEGLRDLAALSVKTGGIFHRRDQDSDLVCHFGKYQSAADFDDLFMCAAYVRRVHDPEFPDAERFP